MSWTTRPPRPTAGGFAAPLVLLCVGNNHTSPGQEGEGFAGYVGNTHMRTLFFFFSLQDLSSLKIFFAMGPHREAEVDFELAEEMRQ